MSIPTPPAFQGAVPPSDIPATQQASSLAPAAHSAVAPEVDTPTMERTPSSAPVPRPAGSLYPPATLKGIDYQGMPEEPKWDDSMGEPDAVLELADGLALAGHSFGAKKSVAGECVFQTGMVGYPESLTDPSYSSQILILTYPLVGNYGVPERPDVETSHVPTSEDAHNVPPTSSLLDSLPLEFESSHIHVAALVVANYHPSFSHHLATSSLGKWLQEQGIPAIWGVDTRMLTKRLREGGVLLGRVLNKRAGILDGERGRDGQSGVLGGVQRLINGLSTSTSMAQSQSIDTFNASWREDFETIPYYDPNQENLVAKVSTKTPVVYTASTGSDKKMHPQTGRQMRVMAIDVGMKWNQIRCFRERGIEVKVVPWNYDINNESEPYDGLFVSNGPGDPSMVKETVSNLSRALETSKVPIFGICLGHQLLALASGAKTRKMKYGNRGMNIPCTCATSGRCYITSQNHGYEVDVTTLKNGWEPLFTNANDGSNEGIWCGKSGKPFFSVQFHPESAPGPRDTEFLFDVFIQSIVNSAREGRLISIDVPGGELAANIAAKPREQVKKVLVLGSGGLSIGQAGEFDYSGSQAIKALKEEGIYTILVNPNIATIQTSKGLADKVYFLPVTPEFVLKIIKHEKPDGIYCTFGGQTALNVGIKLKDEFPKLGVKVLGTPIETIITTEDREMFARAMEEIGEKCAESATAVNLTEAIEAANRIGFPVIVRAAYALGGLGSGFAKDVEQLTELCGKAFATSPQVLVEKSMKGWKEIEYEVVRDCRNNCITVCNMENFDPLGIHTGDSIVIAPSQTLSDADYNMLRTTAVNVIRHLGVVGECNIQYALNPYSKEYCIIEVNARLSRSSALASKATGYPLAFIAAKLGLNIPLNEIRNSVTKLTSACFEPSLDYCVVKIPRWDLKKFNRVSTALSSSMKSVGEVMAIGRTFEETIQKAIRCIDDQLPGFGDHAKVKDLDYEIANPTDKRLFAIAAALKKGYSVEKLNEMSSIDPWFLTRLQRLIKTEQVISQYNASNVPSALVLNAKQLGFADRQIAKMLSSNELAVRRLRIEAGITPFVKQIDTVAAEFPAFTNYLYTTYNATEHDVDFEDNGVMVLGSGVYRIGSSVEFDWCAVRAIRTLRENGMKTVMINYNPETVSTDYDEADKLYFENISLETVLDIYDTEHSSGVVLSMGGQTPNNIALALHRQNVKIYGTSPEMIDTAENRYKFSRMLDKIGVDQPLWRELTSFPEAKAFCDKVGYPVLVRPSYVLSGAAMNVVFSQDDLNNYLTQATDVSRDHPVVISKYIEEAKEIEMDAVARDGKMVMHYISEHVENAGVHSGDATLVLPPQDLDAETVRKIEIATQKIGQALNVTGPYNIQFIAKNNEIKVIECNLRAARSFPFVSKVTGVDAIEIATKVMLGLPVTPYPDVKMPSNYVGVKVPQFSFSRLSGADPVLGVEMASTGEVACFGKDRYDAYLKALISTGIVPPKKNILLSIGSFKEKLEMLPSVHKLHRMGYNLFATAGTADFIQEHGIPVKYLEQLGSENDLNPQKKEYSLSQHLANNLIDLYINLPSKNRFRRPASYISQGYKSRRMAVDFAIPLITNVKNAKLFIEAIIRKPTFDISSVDYQTSHETFTFPGLVSIQAFVPGAAEENSSDFGEATEAAIEGGFTIMQMVPQGVNSAVEDEISLQRAQANASGAAHCDYSFCVAATADNASRLQDAIAAGAKALFIPFNNFYGANNKVSSVSQHFAAWPADKPIITDASATDLASILLLASLNNRSIHITNVSTRDDLLLIALAKEKGLAVTCDVSIYSLFYSQTDFPEAAKVLPSKEDQEALWENLASIDVFSVGVLPYELGQALNKPVSARSGVAESLPLLLTAVTEGKLTLEDISLRLSENPRAIFGLPEQSQTYVEIEVNRRSSFTAEDAERTWSPLDGKAIAGNIHRVVANNHSIFLDGQTFSMPFGRDISASGPRPAKQARGSFALQKRPSVTALMSPISEKTSSAGAKLMSLASVAPIRELSPARGLVSVQTHPTFSRRHILSVKQFDREDLHALFNVASEMRTAVERSGSVDTLRGRVLCTLFYEPSTRTSTSFEAAMKRCGGEVVQVNASTSSVQKGESLADTIRTVGCYADAIALRHPSVGSAKAAAKSSPVPILNAGDGIGEHPTQSLLDVFCIREELGSVNGITVTLIGDLKNGRTVHSLVKLLSLYDVTLNFVSPRSLAMPESVKIEASRAGIRFTESFTLTDEIVSRSDVLYVTRVQKERFENVAEYEAVKDIYVINNDVLEKAKESAIVMHPLPRVNEIDPEVDFDSKRAAYFRQMRYGLFVRMALLTLVMGA
ncbi:carbamoyl-phosphate synthase, large subunit [Cryptococcus neoformans C23]|uniref:Pyrimidine-specific carbamoyl phosphate synthase-aspartate carbamoyl transferase n=1 Tax=Cryptococcus neoformans (strain H99 / ATCC 208821 / CBS 10515 / FGSC 9487) TaxID=235443 RepID=J9VF80_CRYN9|nr:carbamoyl-phosphate synthase, large subunit [Cryptococcus neoformans var. grubii H99]AFR92748.1 carbamoyl-phosphate synthase, large subunit [Cryptococcus neoformans var. grubii H99]AUB22213.1 carbamoyl-phosphate synthase, large subunit [Cryptococcus neoformans var. grubii]OWZ48205.1 carbamoyl-phosphate synthase, large subunit [Cryptococcus neoformans var. grubii C23]|eukprot:XP_012047061.1 carbamoyl-phosphate synthase, large subunit [Cryptococcus neoformans var. grubii H99]